MVRHYGRPARSRKAKAVAFLVLGFALGALGGYVLMGTAHAVLETKAASHYVDAAAAGGAAGGAEQQRQLGQLTPTETGSSKKGSSCSRCIHTLATSNGSPYQNYQMRIAWATYNLILSMPGGENHVAFTRVLHRTKDDALIDEIPTFRANPLQPRCDDWCEYPVSDRANAVQQLFDAAKRDPELIQAPWIYMIESDYVFMKPLMAPPVEDNSVQGWAFPFDYIKPTMHVATMKKLYDGAAADIPNTGPAPILMRYPDWLKVTPDWEKKAAVIEGDKGMRKELGWVREMYGFSTALTLNGLKLDMPPPPQNPFVVQLPIDSGLGKAHAFHYTQCTIYKTMDDKDVWKYDKRFHTSLEDSLNVPLIDEPPPFPGEGKWKFIEGNPVTKAKHEAIVQMIKQMNAGIRTLQPLSAVAQ